MGNGHEVVGIHGNPKFFGHLAHRRLTDGFARLYFAAGAHEFAHTKPRQLFTQQHLDCGAQELALLANQVHHHHVIHDSTVPFA